MTRERLEELCKEQLGGGPYLLSEVLSGSLAQHMIGSRYSWNGHYAEGYVCIRRWPGPEGGPLFAKGTTWAECAQQLGVVETSVETRELFEEPA